MDLLSPDRLAGRAARLPLRLVPRSARMPILAPRHLRGMRWIVSAGLHGCWLGSYERRKRRVFVDEADAGSVIFDVGAQAGYYTLLAARLVGGSGRVVAFEPLPRNLEFIEAHIRLNGLQNVMVVPAAAAQSPGSARFQDDPTSYMGRLSATGNRDVRVETLDRVAAGLKIRVDVIKIDVEGGEAEVLLGAEQILRVDRPVVFLATHGSEPHARSCAILRHHGYDLYPLDRTSLANAREIVARPGILMS
jgi:FkbM family methyltransferase